ncbi:hypothetical protein QAD02_006088, partial [Eretmocerus hayati]
YFMMWKSNGNIFLVTVSLIITFEFVTCHPAVPTTMDSTVCQTELCKKTAMSIMDNMNRNIHPCDDFYEFACGNYMKNSTLAANEFRVDLITTLHEKVMGQMRDAIEKTITKKDPQTFQKISTYYKTCMDEAQIEKDSQRELIEVMKKLGGWPVLENSWDASKFEWTKTVYGLREAGLPYNTIINIDYMPDLQNKNSRVLYLSGVNPGYNPTLLLKGFSDQKVKEFHEYMVNFADILGADRSLAEKEFEKLVNFHIELAKLLQPSLQGHPKVDEPYDLPQSTTIGELQKQCPQVPWIEYIKKTVNPPGQIQKSDRVVIMVPGYPEKYCALLSKTPKRVLANALFWRAASAFADQMGLPIRQAYRQFWLSIGEALTLRSTPRWRFCVKTTRSALPHATAALFVRRYFDKNTKNQAKEIIEYLQQSIRETIDKANWMDLKTRKAATEKLNAMNSLIAYPDELFSDKKIDEYYKNLVIYPNSFIKNHMSAFSFVFDMNAASLKKSATDDDWTRAVGNAADVNAFYDPSDNSFILLAAILQGSFFNAANPKYLNFAGIGSIIGHEIMHGFDNNGRRYDKDGNLNNWWDPTTEKIFFAKAKCFVAQYNHLGANKNITINSELALGENIADNAGLKQAYYAYDNWYKKHGDEPRISGLSFLSPRQVFWVSYANTLCMKERPGPKPLSILMDPHANNKLRVLGPLMNMREFSTDFSCPSNSFMNPDTRCAIL